MRVPLNIASHPARNDRLPALFFAVATVVLLGVSIQHGLLLRRLWPTRSAALRHELVELRSEMQNLRAAAGRARLDVTPGQKTEWKVIRDLIDHRTFRWSELFKSLEDALPPDVRIMSVAPSLKDGRWELEINARLENPDAGARVVRIFEERPEFEGVYASVCSTSQTGVECNYKMRYLASEGTVEVRRDGGSGKEAHTGVGTTVASGAVR